MHFHLLAIKFSVLFSFACLFARTAAWSVSSTIQSNNGAIQGLPRDGNGVLSFKGIPYAQPPVGDLRWRSPQSLTPWRPPLNATAFGYSCISPMTMIPAPTPTDEDCLSLNVWTAANSTSEKRPVMVWFHGGGFYFGGSAVDIYDGGRLSQAGVVVVTVNYRLSVLGFLAHPELDGEGTASGNFGLQDQIMALKWVQANIAAFGGDPDRVTIFGESAGAHAVGLLAASPETQGLNATNFSKPLFHRAIMESGALWERTGGSPLSYTDARTTGLSLSVRLNATNIAEMRNIPATTINKVDAQYYIGAGNVAGSTAFTPSIDGYILPDLPANIWASGKQRQVPMLAGVNGAEYALFGESMVPHNNSEQFKQSLQLYYSNGSTQAENLYLTSNQGNLTTATDDLASDTQIRQQTWQVADWQHAQNPNIPVWIYYFTYTSGYSPVPIHTAEIPFVFGNLVPQPGVFPPRSQMPADTADNKMADTMIAYWTNFASCGDPNGCAYSNKAALPTWPNYERNGGSFQVLRLGSQDQGGINATTLSWVERFEFLAGYRKDGRLPQQWADLGASTLNVAGALDFLTKYWGSA